MSHESIMPSLRAQISMQMSRFLMIQNTMEDTTGDISYTISRHLLNTRLEVLEDNWAKFQTEHERICHMHAERLEEESYLKHRTYERCQEFYVQAKASLLEKRDMTDASNSSAQSSDTPASDSRSSHRVRSLPKISLPTFSGDYHAWRSFCDLFMSMVGENEDITNVEKMHYLKTCLTGDAARLVTNLKVTDTTFSVAWQTLTSRYENKRVLISAQLDRLFSLKPIKARSAQELNTMMTTVIESLGALEALNCPTKTWDPLLVHQLARLLDQDTREAWEVKLGPATLYPTLREFEEFVIGHARALESMASTSGKSAKEKGRFSLFPTKSDTKSRSLIATTPHAKAGGECRLCKSTHSLFNCPTYLSQPTERRKRTAIRLNLCFNCLGTHAASLCPSSRRCRKCGNKHHTTLHDERKPQSKPVSKTDSNGPTVDVSSSLASNSEQK